MKREVKTTNDGSKTLFISDLNEGYHSHHGALQEAIHVFIKNGINLSNLCKINILELGFGTGLNVLVTIDEFLKTDKYHKINYYSIEKYPVSLPEIEALAYDKLFESEKLTEVYYKMHETPWNQPIEILPNFTLTKLQADFFQLPELHMPPLDLVYFDCFGSRVQPDLWEEPLLKLVADKMAKDGIFTTYSSKGSMKRALQGLNFEVTKRPGPPGKREMLTAEYKGK